VKSAGVNNVTRMLQRLSAVWSWIVVARREALARGVEARKLASSMWRHQNCVVILSAFHDKLAEVEVETAESETENPIAKTNMPHVANKPTNGN